MACVDVAETAAEKLVSLTRRTAMELAGVSRKVDPTLVRHLYDLHMLRGHIDVRDVATLAREIALTDAEEFRHQHPSYEKDRVGETRKALAAISNDPVYRQRYEDFLAAFVYGEKPGFDEAMRTVVEFAEAFTDGSSAD